MKEIKTRHLNKFLKTHSEVAIGTVKIKISRSKKVREYQPKHLARAKVFSVQKLFKRVCGLLKESNKVTMRKTAKLCLILLPVSVLMLAFCVSVARARGGSFVIESMQEAVENVDLGVSDQVFGNLSVSSGYIDFFITNPSGAIVQGFHNVSYTSFSFVASENGTYSMHLENAYQAYDVTVKLDYGVKMTINAQVGLNIGVSSGFAQVRPLPPPPPEPDNDEPDNLVEQYLNLLRASDILRTASSARTILPIRNVTFMSIIASVAGLAMVISPRARRPGFHTHTCRTSVSLR
jgi:hypothetical protein